MKTNKTPASSQARDRQRVAGEQDWEISYLTRKLNVSESEVEAAIKKVGNSRQKVEEFLTKKQNDR